MRDKSFCPNFNSWGDRNNQCLMKTLQVLHNKCAKIVLNIKPYDSSTKALDSLHWKCLDFRRKFHQCATVYKSKKNDISYTFNNKTGKDLHNIQTRNNEQYHLPKVATNRESKGHPICSLMTGINRTQISSRQETLIFLNKGFGQCKLI